MEQDLTPEPGLARLPVNAWNGIFVEDLQSRQAGADRNGEIRRGDFLQIEFGHDVLGDLAAFGSPVLQARQPVLHIGNPALETAGESLINQG